MAAHRRLLGVEAVELCSIFKCDTGVKSKHYQPVSKVPSVYCVTRGCLDYITAPRGLPGLAVIGSAIIVWRTFLHPLRPKRQVLFALTMV